MGAFNINITGVGNHGCERRAKEGDKLFGRCGRFTCPDCAAYEFVQRLRQMGALRDDDQAYNVEVSVEEATLIIVEGTRQFKPGYWAADGKYYRKTPHQAVFTHWPDSSNSVVDDMLKNERRSGHF